MKTIEVIKHTSRVDVFSPVVHMKKQFVKSSVKTINGSISIEYEFSQNQKFDRFYESFFDFAIDVTTVCELNHFFSFGYDSNEHGKYGSYRNKMYEFIFIHFGIFIEKINDTINKIDLVENIHGI